MPKPNRGQHEQTRLVFAGAIVAALLAYVQAQVQLVDLIGQQSYRFGLVTLFASAAFAFMFLVASAAAVKYTERGKLDIIRLSFQDRQVFYDLSVVVLELVPLFLIWGALMSYFASSQPKAVAMISATVTVMLLQILFSVVLKLFTTTVKWWNSGSAATFFTKTVLGKFLIAVLLGIVIMILAL